MTALAYNRSNGVQMFPFLHTFSSIIFHLISQSYFYVHNVMFHYGLIYISLIICLAQHFANSCWSLIYFLLKNDYESALFILGLFIFQSQQVIH